LLVTTFWNEVSETAGQRREKELLEDEDAWKSIIVGGAKVERMGREYSRFKPILEKMSRSVPTTLLVQRELHSGKDLAETMAGLSVQELKTGSSRQVISRRQAVEAVVAETAERRKSQAQVREEARKRAYEEEFELQRLENERIMLQMQETTRMQEQAQQQKRKELEEQRQAQQVMRDKLERERQDVERGLLKQRLESIAEIQYGASTEQKRNVNEATDFIVACRKSPTLVI
jgi:hypothetical protein